MRGHWQTAWVCTVGLVEMACLRPLPPPAPSAPDAVEDAAGTPDGSGASDCSARDADSYALCVDNCVIHGQRFEVTIGGDASLRGLRVGAGDVTVTVVPVTPVRQGETCSVTKGEAFVEATGSGGTTRVLADGRIFLLGPDAATFAVDTAFLGPTPDWDSLDREPPDDEAGSWTCGGYCAKGADGVRSVAWHWFGGGGTGTCSVNPPTRDDALWRFDVTSTDSGPSLVFKAAPQGCRDRNDQANNPVQLLSFGTSELCRGDCGGIDWMADGLLKLDWPDSRRGAILSLPSGVTSFGVAIQLACDTSSDCPGQASCPAGHCSWRNQPMGGSLSVRSGASTVEEVLVQPSVDGGRLIAIMPNLGAVPVEGETRELTLVLSPP